MKPVIALICLGVAWYIINCAMLKAILKEPELEEYVRLAIYTAIADVILGLGLGWI